MWGLYNEEGALILRNDNPEYLRGVRDGLVYGELYSWTGDSLDKWKVREVR